MGWRDASDCVGGRLKRRNELSMSFILNFVNQADKIVESCSWLQLLKCKELMQNSDAEFDMVDMLLNKCIIRRSEGSSHAHVYV